MHEIYLFKIIMIVLKPASQLMTNNFSRQLARQFIVMPITIQLALSLVRKLITWLGFVGTLL